MLDEISDVKNGRDELDDAIDSSGEQTVSVANSDDLEDPRGEVVQGVGSSQLVEQEEHHSYLC